MPMQKGDVVKFGQIPLKNLTGDTSQTDLKMVLQVLLNGIVNIIIFKV